MPILLTSNVKFNALDQQDKAIRTSDLLELIAHILKCLFTADCAGDIAVHVVVMTAINELMYKQGDAS